MSVTSLVLVCATIIMTEKNIWLAASDGDLARVKFLVETENLSANAYDENKYTPLHAAASWNHGEVLRYLVSRGGDINICDGDGETPLFVVENEAMAHLCIELGADVKHRNAEGVSAAEHHAEDNPDLATYLADLAGEMLRIRHPNASSDMEDDNDEEGMELQSDLLTNAQAVLAEADRTGAEPDEALRQVIQAAMSQHAAAGSNGPPSLPDAKRRRDDVGR